MRKLIIVFDDPQELKDRDEIESAILQVLSAELSFSQNAIRIFWQEE